MDDLDRFVYALDHKITEDERITKLSMTRNEDMHKVDIAFEVDAFRGPKERRYSISYEAILTESDWTRVVANVCTRIRYTVDSVLRKQGGEVERLGKDAMQMPGVALTAEQTAKVRALMEANDIVGAQRMILEILDLEFGKLEHEKESPLPPLK
jgi:hypothetical protein